MYLSRSRRWHPLLAALMLFVAACGTPAPGATPDAPETVASAPAPTLEPTQAPPPEATPTDAAPPVAAEPSPTAGPPTATVPAPTADPTATQATPAAEATAPATAAATEAEEPAGSTGTGYAPAGISGLRVEGNNLVNGAGEAVRLRGVNRSGTEYACIQGWGFFDGPGDDASLKAIRSWNANAVRVPLNETCWLGINGAPEQYAGENYKKTIREYVDLINKNGMVAILDLHWSAWGDRKAEDMESMPNRDHSIDFWREVAAEYKDNSAVIFDVFNEPFPGDNGDDDAAWTCWRDGGACGQDRQGGTFEAAGMQDLVTAVRSTGAKNVIMLGGVQYSNNLSRWLEFKPEDPENNVVPAWHIYAHNRCNSEDCWNREVGPVASQLPLITGEMGETEEDCGREYIESVMGWLDERDASYLAWTWNPWKKCTDLITHFDGTPTPLYGAAIREHYMAAKDGVGD